MRPVLYYVHHHGLGHWRRALAMTAELQRPVIFASSARPPQPLPLGASYVELPADAPAGGGVDANGRLHWAPTGHAGLLNRHQALLAAAAAHDVVLAVVDVSVEVAVLLRASGVPVIAVRLPGERTDPAHQLGFDLADEVVMPVPEVWGLHEGLTRTRAVGLVGARGRSPADAVMTGLPVPSRGRPARPLRSSRARPRLVVVVGAGGSDLDTVVCGRIATELPAYDVRVLGLAAGPHRDLPPNLRFLGRIADPRAELLAATAVIGNAGLGTVCDVLTARRPFVVVPGERPFDEQVTTGRALARAGHAVVLPGPPAAGGWRPAVEAALALRPEGLVVDGAARFARLVQSHADRHDRVEIDLDLDLAPDPAGAAL